MAKRLTFYIMIGLILGIVTGAVLHASIADSALLAEIGKWLGLVTTVFLRLIKMIIAPLVFATLVSGIVHMGDTAALGRVGAKTIGWFVGATLVSLTLGMFLVNWLHPGIGGGFTLPPPTATADIAKPAKDIFQILAEMFPASIIEGMANNTLLQIVIFSLFFGVAMTAVAITPMAVTAQKVARQP